MQKSKPDKIKAQTYWPVLSSKSPKLDPVLLVISPVILRVIPGKMHAEKQDTAKQRTPAWYFVAEREPLIFGKQMFNSKLNAVTVSVH